MKDTLGAGIRALVRWQIEELKLPKNITLEIELVETRTVSGDGDTITLQGHVYRRVGDGYGKNGIKDYRSHTLDIDLRKQVLRWHATLDKREIIDTIRRNVAYLIAYLRPPPKPKGFPILLRRRVLAPAPRFRSRLRCSP